MNKRKPTQQPGRRPSRQAAAGDGRGARHEVDVERDDEPAWAQHSRSARLARAAAVDPGELDADDGTGDDIDIAPHGAERMSRAPRRGVAPAGRRSAPPAAARSRGNGDADLEQAGGDDGPSPVGVLTCVAGPEEGLGLTLTEGTFGIGRGRDNHFVLKDIAASRQHVEIRVHRGEVMVVDLGSGNGTRINGKRIQQATLKAGDRIEIGNSALTFTPLGGARQSRREISVVPPRPAPKPKDLWPETETLLSELKEFEARAQPRGLQQRGVELPAPQRHPVSPQLRAYGSSALEDEGGLDDLAGLGQPPRFGSTGWLLAGAGLIVVLIGLAALIFYLTQIKNSRADQARQFVMQGMQEQLKNNDEAAKRAFEEALTLDPKNLDAKTQLDQLERSMQVNTQIARAQSMLAAKNFDEARHALENLPKDVRAKDVDDLRRAINRAEVDDLVAKGQADLKAGRLEQAAVAADRAVSIDGNHAGVRALQQEIDKAKDAAAAAVAPKEPEPAKVVEPEKPKEVEKRQPVRQPKKKKPRTVRESRPAPPPSEPSTLSDSEARQLFEDGREAFKDGQNDKAKRIMQTIIKKTPASSEWRQKAESFIERKLQ